jgi:sugar lactone lactonase YvrE
MGASLGLINASFLALYIFCIFLSKNSVNAMHPLFSRASLLLLVGLLACHTDPSPPVAVRPLTYTSVSTLGSQNPLSEGISAIAVDAQGTVYATAPYTNLILKVNSAGVISKLAGGGSTVGFADGIGDAARFNRPQGIAVDAQGNIYVGDTYNNRIRKITPAGVVTTFAGTGQAGYKDGPGNSAQFYLPFGLTVDAQGTVFVADYANERIRKITSDGVVSTVAGSGTRGFKNGRSEEAQFYLPGDVAVDAQGTVYVAEYGNSAVRAITTAGIVSTQAGTGISSSAVFDTPQGLDADAQGNVYVADTDNSRIRLIIPNGTVSTIAGSPDGGGQAAGHVDGFPLMARFSYPTGIAISENGTLYVADRLGVRIISAK